MTRIKVIIVDDEVAAQESLKNILTRIDFIEIIGFAFDVDSAFALILDNKPDIIFLDVNLPRRNGFELLHEMKSYDIVCEVIFVTAYDKWAISALRHCALDYLLKPINFEELEAALNRFRGKSYSSFENKIDQLLECINTKKLQFNNRTGYVLINPVEIFYCKAEGNYTNIFLSNGNEELVTTQIGEIESMVEIKSMFRISRSLLINTAFISSINRKSRILSLSKNGFSHEIKVPKDKMRLVMNI